MKVKRNKAICLVVVIIFPLLNISCMKDFLDVKQDSSQVIPVTLDDYETMLNNWVLNYGYPFLGEVSSDDFYVKGVTWNNLSSATQKNGYVWEKDIFQGESSLDWNQGFERILYANFILEGVEKLSENESGEKEYHNVLGSALFIRGYNYFILSQVFCDQYDEDTAAIKLGLPLRQSSNINLKYDRSSLLETVKFIESDLKRAAILLPIIAKYNTLPSRMAAWAALANLYLQMGKYQDAKIYADSLLQVNKNIIDYNNIDVNVNLPFPRTGQGNEEVIFYSQMNNATILSNSRLIVDSLLYDSYLSSDLRKNAFFYNNAGVYTFKGHYSGLTANYFCGLTVPEILLIRAECYARLGEVEGALLDLNTLLKNRYKKEDFEPVNRISHITLLPIILNERRKELVFRGKRWGDLKRFRKEGLLKEGLIRHIENNIFELPLNSSKWILPIPQDVVNIGGLLPNIRN